MGDFRQGKIHGRGRFTYKNGDYYDGGWDQEEMHGQGIKVPPPASQLPPTSFATPSTHLMSQLVNTHLFNTSCVKAR